MTKFREVKIQPDVTLPALSTEIPERSYSYVAFLIEWCLSSAGMRTDENLPHLFALEEAIEARPLAPGDVVYLVDAVHAAAKAAAKAALDEALTPNQMGQTRIPQAYALKVLRHYHAFASAQAVDETDIPRPLQFTLRKDDRERTGAMTNGAADVAAAPPAS